MRCLPLVRQNWQRVKPMKRVVSTGPANQTGRSAARGGIEGAAAEPLEVNVIYTEPAATAVALRAAAVFTRELDASIRLRAGIVVPFQLPLDQPLISVDFFKHVLRDLVDQSQPDGIDCTIHLYICRDWLDTLSGYLKPNSVVVIVGRKRWRPTRESRMARALLAEGQRIALVDIEQHKEGRET